MKVAVVGSREYPDMDAVRAFVARLPAGTVVISGGARGVDSVAAHAARECGLGVVLFMADWENLGKRAGAVRNQQMVDAADHVIAFWDGKSPGTKIAMDMAERAGKLRKAKP